MLLVKKFIKTPHLLLDEKKRYENVHKFIAGKNILDFGCGWGYFLFLATKDAKKCNGIELSKERINFIKKNFKKIIVKNNINNFSNKFDLITMFHVLEHIPNQVKTLKIIREKIKKKGKVIVEVPSAQDFLISIKELPEFRKFTFWSEHLVLHTEKSLKKVLISSGFKKVKIKYVQRYGYANHLGWFLTKRPGGHEYFKKYSDKNTENSYAEHLIKRKQTDTLIGIGEN